MTKTEIEALRTENARLRAELDAARTLEARRAERDAFERDTLCGFPLANTGPALWASLGDDPHIAGAGRSPREAFGRALADRLDAWLDEPGDVPPIEEFARDVLHGGIVRLDGDPDAIEVLLDGGDRKQPAPWGRK